MEIVLSDKLKAKIKSLLATGEYDTVEDLISQALEILAASNQRKIISQKVQELFDKTQSLPSIQDITEEEIAAEIEAYRNEQLNR